MWIYERKLQYPVNIKTPNPKLATAIITQLGGPDGELGASLRYLNQRYSMPDKEIIGTLTDIGTEELAHMEMIASIVYQLTRNLSEKEINESPFASYFVDHTTGIYPVSAAGVPFDTKYLAVKGDPITDLNEDLAAEQKARTTYDNILRLADDPSLKLHQAWIAECVKRGVFFTNHHNHFINASLSDADIAETVEIADEAFAALKNKN